MQQQSQHCAPSNPAAARPHSRSHVQPASSASLGYICVVPPTPAAVALAVSPPSLDLYSTSIAALCLLCTVERLQFRPLQMPTPWGSVSICSSHATFFPPCQFCNPCGHSPSATSTSAITAHSLYTLCIPLPLSQKAALWLCLHFGIWSRSTHLDAPTIALPCGTVHTRCRPRALCH